MREIGKKLVLTNTVVFSSSDISTKLKHISDISTNRDQIVSKLIGDKLLIPGEWFGTTKANGDVTLMVSYLKAYPNNGVTEQKDFADLLASYNIDYEKYEESFKKQKNENFPRVLTISDIKNKSWLYSNVLEKVIQDNTFLFRRIKLDPSTVVKQSNGNKYFIFFTDISNVFFYLFHSYIDK